VEEEVECDPLGRHGQQKSPLRKHERTAWPETGRFGQRHGVSTAPLWSNPGGGTPRPVRFGSWVRRSRSGRRDGIAARGVRYGIMARRIDSTSRRGTVVLIDTGTARYWGEDGADDEKLRTHDSKSSRRIGRGSSRSSRRPTRSREPSAAPRSARSRCAEFADLAPATSWLELAAELLRRRSS
jgi:hypothetical protein